MKNKIIIIVGYPTYIDYDLIPKNSVNFINKDEKGYLELTNSVVIKKTNLTFCFYNLKDAIQPKIIQNADYFILQNSIKESVNDFERGLGHLFNVFYDAQNLLTLSENQVIIDIKNNKLVDKIKQNETIQSN